ncbi:hypothetical protein K1T71_004142 [Dendrolimus kikuchii]|uniref:Uncharacterized protein n=1 Tax=Dendrolimus kikuchii TaxID=765133 RepID=A0ACC1D9Y6_9NEOP|nr:hypothetical protein K1T71_004142 [Dendrolimus kikuchii]
MKRIFAKFRDKISFKELPPPYRETENDVGQEQQGSYDQNNGPACEVLDLLANCTISPTPNDCEESTVEYAEIRDMGLWHSSPLAHRHKSKISLTWVLKENLERTKLPEKVQKDEWIKKPVRTEVDKLQRQNQKFNENNQPKKCMPGEIKERVVGRNEYYHNLRFRTACEEFVNGQETYSDTSIGTEEYVRRKHRHRHRRKKTKQNSKFGYDIKDLDSFLTEATIDRPGNIPVVIAYPSTLYQTQKGKQRELTLPLGTVVNAVFKNEQWLYVQTPHGQEGYVMYGACLPLGILPDRPSSQKKTPCWESSTDIYPRPCGNLTDNEKEQLNGKTRSECRYKPKQQRKKQNSCAEKDFDTLYLKTKSVSNIDKLDSNLPLKSIKMKKQTLLVVSSDFKGSALNRTLSVQKGDVVTLVQGVVESDVDAEWFYVKKKDGKDGFIPASIAGHGYI